MKEKEGKSVLSTGGIVWTIWHYVIGALLIVLGILAIVNNANEDWQKAFIIVIGAFIILDGVLRVVANVVPLFVSATKDKPLEWSFAIIGTLEMAGGITLIVDRAAADAIAALLTYFVAILALAAAGVLIIFGILFLVKKVRRVITAVLQFILAAGLIALGVYILVEFDPNGSASFYAVVLIITGVVVVLVGVTEIVLTTIKLMTLAKLQKAADKVVESGEQPAEEPRAEPADVIDVEPEQIEEKPKEIEE